MKSTPSTPTNLSEMAEKYRKIRMNQPSLTAAEMRAQTERNQRLEGERLLAKNSDLKEQALRRLGDW